MRTGVFIDVSNIYHRAAPKRLEYGKLARWIRQSFQVSMMHAHGAAKNGEAAGFRRILHSLGFKTFYKDVKQTPEGEKANCDIEIVIDILSNAHKLDTVILVSADSDFTPVVEKLQAQGIKVYILGVDISVELKKVATAIEIPVSWLRG